MSRIRFTTAGESHGPALSAIVEGLPAGVPVSSDAIDHELRRRQGGYGRGGRMRIETRPRRDPLRRAPRRDAGLARHAAGAEPRLGQLDRRHVGRSGGERGRRRGDAPRLLSPPRPRRPGGRAQVRPHRRPRRAGARQRPRDGGTGGRRRAGEGAAGRGGDRGGQPRGVDRRRRGGRPRVAPRRPERRQRPLARALPGRRGRGADDRRHRRGEARGRHAGRGGRGGGPRGAGRARVARLVGPEAGRAAGAAR